MKSLIFVIVCAVVTIILALMPSWADEEWRFDPNGLLDTTGTITVSDSNSFFILGSQWELPVYECKKHGEVTNVITVWSNSRSEATCGSCFLDVFPPLKKVK